MDEFLPRQGIGKLEEMTGDLMIEIENIGSHFLIWYQI